MSAETENNSTVTVTASTDDYATFRRLLEAAKTDIGLQIELREFLDRNPGVVFNLK